MKAGVYTVYGPPDVLRIAEVEKPTPDENQVLVKVHAASIIAGDSFARAGKRFPVRFFTGGFPRPQNTRLGSDVAGHVEVVGEKVNRFRQGDEVFGCGWLPRSFNVRRPKYDSFCFVIRDGVFRELLAQLVDNNVDTVLDPGCSCQFTNINAEIKMAIFSRTICLKSRFCFDPGIV